MDTSKNNKGFPWQILFAGILSGIILVIILLVIGNYQGWWGLSGNGYSRMMSFYNTNPAAYSLDTGITKNLGLAGPENQAYWDDFDRQLIQMENDINQIRDYHNLMENEFNEVNLSGGNIAGLSDSMTPGKGEIAFSADGKKWVISYSKNNQTVSLDLSQLKSAMQADPKMTFQINILDATGKVLKTIDNRTGIADSNLTLDEKAGQSLTLNLTVNNGDGSKFTTSQTIN